MSMNLGDIAKQVLNDAEQSYQENGSFAPEIIQALYEIFDESLLDAFDILDRFKFVAYKLADAIRCLYQLTSNREHYLLFDEVNHCTCDAFVENTLRGGVRMTCGHVLAVQFARMTGKIVIESVKEVGMRDLLVASTNDDDDGERRLSPEHNFGNQSDLTE